MQSTQVWPTSAPAPVAPQHAPAVATIAAEAPHVVVVVVEETVPQQSVDSDVQSGTADLRGGGASAAAREQGDNDEDYEDVAIGT